MKSFSLLLKLLLVVFTFVGCAKKDGAAPGSEVAADPTAPSVGSAIVISAKTTTSFTATWGAASDDTTAATALLYKMVYSTTNNLTTATLAETNGTLVLDWTANALTANMSSLTQSTTYYLAVLVKDADNKVSLESGTGTTLCSGKKMFLANVSDGSFGGKAGADAACSAQRPGGVGVYKAMLGDSTGVAGNGLPAASGRQACYGNCEASNLYVYDWVFATNRTYCTADFSAKVGTSGATYPVLYVPVGSVLSTTPVKLFTGFNIAWGNSTGSNCNNWSTTSGTFVAGNSSGLYTGQGGNHDFIADSTFPTCAGSGAVVCVEQ